MWRVFGDDFSTAAMTDKSMFQKVTFDRNYIIKGVRTWLIFYNDPTITSVNMKIYSDEGGSPRKLLATSTNTLTKAQMITLENGVKEIYFDFDNFPVKQDNNYHFVINGVGYTGSASSHVAWMKGFPDPVLTQTPAVSYANLLTCGYQIYFIGSVL